MLAKMLLRRRVRQQSKFFIPALRSHRLRRPRCRAFIFLRNRHIAKRPLQLRAIPQRLRKLQRHHRRAAIFFLRRHSVRKIRAPIHKGPPRNLAKQSIRALPPQKPIERCPRPGHLAAHKIRIAPIHPEVVHHSHPHQRKCRNHLRQRRWIPARRQSIRHTRIIKRFNRLPPQPVVARHRVRNQRLNPRVADVLQPLPVRRIHISVVRVQPRRPPSNLPDGLQRAVVRMKISLLHKWIRAEPRLQSSNSHRRVSRLHINLQISPSPPAQRRKFSRRRAASWQEFIRHSLDMFPRNLVAISFLSFRIVKRFRIRQSDRRAAPSAHREHRIPRRQLSVIQQQTHFGVNAKRESRHWRTDLRRNSTCPHHTSRRNFRHLHRRQRIAHQLPVIRCIPFFSQRSTPQRHRLRPISRPWLSRSARVPIEFLAVYPQSWLSRVVTVHFRPYRFNSSFDFDFPCRVRVYRSLRVSRSMKQESRPVAYLRNRAVLSKIPNYRRQHVLSRVQHLRNVIRFIPPVRQIPAARSPPRLAPVHIQNKLIVRAHMHNKMFRHSRQLNRLSEMQHRLVPLPCASRRDPLRAPMFLRRRLPKRIGAACKRYRRRHPGYNPIRSCHFPHRRRLSFSVRDSTPPPANAKLSLSLRR